MIVAYLLLVHANPRQVGRLVAALPATSPVFIHVDRNTPAPVFEAIRAAVGDRPDTMFVTRHACRWGAIGIVRGTMALIDAAVGSGLAFDYATLLSGADYPIKSEAEIARILTEHRGTEFIESFAMDAPNRWSDNGGLYRAPDRMTRRHLRFRSRVLRLPWRRALPYGLRPFGGEQWWTLTREAVDFVSRTVAERPGLMRFMAGVFIPDECFVQTVLAASPMAGRVAGRSLRLSVWDRPAPPYPATLVAADLPLLAASDALFARKFSDAADDRVYAAIDRDLRGA